MARIGKATSGNKTWDANHHALGSLSSVTRMRSVKVEHLDGMTAVRQHAKDMYEFQGSRGGRWHDYQTHVMAHVVEGNRAAADRAADESTALIDAAIAMEPRLARKPQWERGEDGIFADAGLVASGDDSPCFDMRRRSFRDAQANGEPVTVVVSTDSSTPTNLAAFVAVVRLVQQFRPVNVWWQGGWLADDGREAGYVFLAPLIQGDMDFARLAYVVADYTRDLASFSVLHQTATVRDHMQLKGMGRPADRSYLPDAIYVDRKGITPDAESVAAEACRWLGLESPWSRRWHDQEATTAALQTIPKEYKDERTEAQKKADQAENDKRWQQYSAEQAAKRAADAAARLANVGE